MKKENENNSNEGNNDDNDVVMACKIDLATFIDTLISIYEVGVEYIDLSITTGKDRDTIDVYIQEEYMTGNLNMKDESDLENLA